MAALPRQRPEFKDKRTNTIAAGDDDGRAADCTVRLDGGPRRARETRETIWVEVAGDEPRLTLEGYAQVHGLVFAPWVGRDGKIKRAFRADAVTALADVRKVSAA